MEQLYDSGEEIHIGDHVRYAGHLGKIVFVVDRDEYLPDFPKKEWARHKTGFMIQTPAYRLVMLDRADEDLELLGRAKQTI